MKVTSDDLRKKGFRHETLMPECRYAVPLSKGLSLIYYKSLDGWQGTWTARLYHQNRYQRFSLGLADDASKPDGVRILSFDQAVKAAEAKAKEAIAGGSQEAYTVAKAAADWLKNWKKSEAGKKNAEGTVRNHIVPTLGHIELAKLKTHEIEDWLHSLASKPPMKNLSPKSKSKFNLNDRETKRKRRDTANRILNDLFAILNNAYRHEKVDKKAAWERVEKFENVGRAKNQYLTPDECKRFIAACPHDFASLVRGAVATGCRYMELATMQVSAYDPEGKRISVIQGKTQKPKHVYLTDEEAIFFASMAAGKRSTELLFTQIDSNPWLKSMQQPRMRTALKAASINRHVRFHDLRHSMATWLAMAGTSIQLIAKQLGHRGTRIAEEHYTHFDEDYVASTIRANKPSMVG